MDEVYCTNDFIKEFDNLKTKKKCKDLENLVLDYFLNNSFDIVAAGSRLFGPDHLPYLKKRIPDAGGYRLYFLADINTKKIYINFVHTKTPPLGYANIGLIKKKSLHDSVLVSKNSNTGLFKLSRCPINNTAIFI